MCFGDVGLADDDSGAKTRPGEEAGGERQTYRTAMGPIGQFMGGQESDQDYENDRRVGDALRGDLDPETGERMFTNVNTGRRQSVGSYSRESSGVRPGSVLANISSGPSLGTLLGAGVSMVVGGIPGIVAGQMAKRGYNTFLGGGK